LTVTQLYHKADSLRAITGVAEVTDSLVARIHSLHGRLDDLGLASYRHALLDRACRALLAGWTKIGPEAPLPNDLKQGDDIEFNVGSGAASGQRAIIAVGQLNGETRYFTAIAPGDSGWHKAITAYRRNGDKGPPPWPVPQ